MDTEELRENWNGNYYADFSELKGKTIKKIDDLTPGSDTVVFECTDGTRYQMHYYPDCCAHASVEEVVGDVSDLIDSEILMAEVVSSTLPDETKIAERKAEYEKKQEAHKARYGNLDDFYTWGPSPSNDWSDESETWVFYKLATLRGHVTIRWYGSSNGYYSETADFERLK